MSIDLHIHTKTCSDGRWPLPDVIRECRNRGLAYISITDHDSIDCQESARRLALDYGIHYLTGVELNVSVGHPRYRKGKPASLDALGYGFDPENGPLREKLRALREYRKARAQKILENINREFQARGLPLFTGKDLAAIEETVDGAFGRPHIASYLVKKKIVSSRQEAFDQYLVRCDVPKMPLSIKEASELIRGAGGKLVLAHPNDPNGTSLISFTSSIEEQFDIIREIILPHIDGVECWHSRHDRATRTAYLAFARQEGLIVTGGSDCHQNPPIMGSVKIPRYVTEQFRFDGPSSSP
ncbi:MAG: PHP domain-containing protein [Deltaproteobacteria bacterium]|nr:PHP domain-containing protein [Deltaproteobacteria bacterium]MBW1950295.1 PHP domain-containing protein [Deltaproteobacteria bacterium]MBW2009744.1 PHP domain-containing protein [Deltaproteobacteria bacterium]MBW2349456.1 PHP domain-containing protein [Deltaproteobacteria bacterium]